MRKHLIPSLEQSNTNISNLIEAKKSFLVGRVGLGGGTAITALTYAKQPIHPQFYIWIYQTEGFYGIPNFDRFAQLYFNSIQSSDLQAYWGDPSFPGFIEYENFITPPNQSLIEPGSLDAYVFERPWTQKLAGKKVLIIHSFKESIDKQLKIKDKIWSNDNFLPEAEYLTYKPVQSLGGFGPHTSWYDSFDRMCDDISKIDFDIALVAAGGYGMPLCGFIKESLNKGAIYVGGCLQLFFGIKGRRWDTNNNITKLYNENWIRASLEETPSSAPLVENSCYW